MKDYLEEEQEQQQQRHKKIDEIAEELVESVEFNAWEYGNSGNFIYN